MATSKNTKSQTTKVSTKTTENTKTVSAPEEETPKKTYKVKQSIDPNTVVTVKNGFQGTLVYKSSRTGERFVWEEFGDEQEMDLQELKNVRNSSKAFFVNNWFLIDDVEILDYLGVAQYYKYALTSEGFDELFSLSPDEIEEKVSKLSQGQKSSLAYRTKLLIAEGKVDSIKVITALENSLGVELIEK